MRNRLASHLRTSCRCVEAEHVKQRFDAVAAQLSSANPDLLEFRTPSLSSILDRDEDAACIRWWVNCDVETICNLSAAHESVSCELRLLAGKLLDAADAIEAKGGGA